ncbi:MAG TPA: S8 family serine peptidase, partial [Streptosporangiaceae bacterium]
ADGATRREALAYSCRGSPEALIVGGLMRQSARWLLAGALAVAASIPVMFALATPSALATRSAIPEAVAASTTPSPTTSATASPSPSQTSSAQPTATPTPSAPPAPVGPPPPVLGMPLPAGNCPPELGVRRLTREPWAQRALDFSAVWRLTRGAGVMVAVVDSGVDYSSQLAGRVSYIDVTLRGPRDCVGHGTAVASLIAAADARARGVSFYGVAPAARILSVKVNAGDTGRPGLLAQGIRDAAMAGAQVINVSVQTAQNSPVLRAAVAYAVRQDAVVVAAAGNDNPGGGVGPYYPASYPGVISVGAIDQTGALTSYTDRKTRVSVTAPGENIASAWPGGFNPANQGTSFAAAFVSGVAALVRAAYPRLTAAQVARRIEATADGSTGAHTGAGVVNPVQAVTAVLPVAARSPAAPRQAVTVPGPRRGDPFTRLLALSIAGGSVATAAMAAVGAMVLPRARRRRWRPGRDAR